MHPLIESFLNSSYEKYVRFTLYIILIILINLVSQRLFFRFDLTNSGQYTLSRASSETVSTLSEPLTVKIFFSKNLPAPYNGVERYLRDLMQEYAIKGNRYFNYEFINLGGQESAGSSEIQKNKRLAANYGIRAVQLQQLENDEVKFRNAYMGLVLIHGNMIERIPVIQSEKNLEYKITSSIQKLHRKISSLKNIEGTIKVNLVLSSSLYRIAPYIGITNLNALPEKMNSMIDRLNYENYSKLEYEFINPEQNPGVKEELSEADMLELNWESFQTKDGTTVDAGRGFIGILLSHKDKTEIVNIFNMYNIPGYSPQYELYSDLEISEMIQSAVDTMININEKIVFLTNHGTTPLYYTETVRRDPAVGRDHGKIENFRTLLQQSYQIEGIGLPQQNIPSGVKTMIISAPRKEFSDYELYQIDQFLMNGNSVAVFLDRFEQQPSINQNQAVQFGEVDTGLNKLLKHYGVDVRKAYVLDKNCFEQVAQNQVMTIFYAPMLQHDSINNELPYIRNIRQLITLQMSPVLPVEERISNQNLEYHEIISSSDKSWLMEGQINLSPMYMYPPLEEDMTSYPLAVMLEGSFESYFADTGMPSQEGTDSENTLSVKADRTIKKGKPGKLFVIGSSKILYDNMIDQNGRTGNAVFILNIIDELNGRTEQAVLRAKNLMTNPLVDASPAERTVIKMFNIIVLPVLTVIAGFLALIKRIRRKKKLRKQFSAPKQEETK